MALLKDVTLDNGLVLGYHRVSDCSIASNKARFLTVRSYQSAAARASEKQQQADGVPQNVFYHEQQFLMPYDESVGLTDAYTWLKQTELFDGATDATDDDEPVQPTEPVMTVSDLADAVADLSESVSDNSTELSDAIAELAQLVSDIDEKVSNL